MDALRKYVTAEALEKLERLPARQQEKVLAMVRQAAFPKLSKLRALTEETRI
jgi:hypothetical protein